MASLKINHLEFHLKVILLHVYGRKVKRHVRTLAHNTTETLFAIVTKRCDFRKAERHTKIAG